MTKIEFNTRKYETSHLTTPRGRGSWAFQPTSAYFKNGDYDSEQTLWSPSMTYTEAKAWARRNAPDGVTALDVLP